MFWGVRKVTVVLVAASVGLSSCMTFRGVSEFEAYRTAFDQAHTTSTSILDQLAVRERALYMRLNPTSRATFNPDLAGYYTTSTDPPGTAAYRRALDTIKVYNDLLYGLASGQTTEALVSRVSTLSARVKSAGTEVTRLGATVTGAGSGALLSAAGSLSAVYAAATPFIEIALRARSRADFRAFATQYHPLVRTLLEELRKGTTVIFPVLTAEIRRRSRIDPTGGGLNAKERQQIDTYRKLLADWVVLIDASIVALDTAIAAINADSTVTGSLSGLTATAVELETAARSARTHLAELGAN